MRISCEHNLPETSWISRNSLDVAFNVHVHLKLSLGMDFIAVILTEMKSKWIFMWTELVFTPVWNLKLVWVHFAYHVNILLLSGNTMQPEKTYSPYLPTVLHRAGHVRILLNILWYACIEKMSCIFKNPLKFSHIILYFHFYNNFIFRVSSNWFFILQDGQQ